MSKEVTTRELRSFYVGRSKNPALFDYDANGNLIEKDKSGETVRTIAALPMYRKPTMEEVDEMEAKHKEAIAEASRAYEDARTNLYQASQEELQKNAGTRDKKRLLTLNRLVMEADEALQLVRYPLRGVIREEGVSIRRLEFEKTHEERKYPYEIAVFTTRPFTLQDQYVRIGEAPVAPAITVSEARQQAMKESKQPVILFDGNEDSGAHGFLSLGWPVQMEFNQTMYHSAKQAIAAEMAKQLGTADQLQRIMITQSPAEVSYTVDNVGGAEKEAAWNNALRTVLREVQRVKFQQFPELGARLLATQNAVLGAYFPNENYMGIGISMDRPQAKLPSEWTGQNELGQALMMVRDELRAMQPAASAAPAAVRVPPRRKPSVKAATAAASSDGSQAATATTTVTASTASTPSIPTDTSVKLPMRRKKPVVVAAEPAASDM